MTTNTAMEIGPLALSNPGISVIGEVMLELSSTPGGLYSLGVAGDTYNTAVAIAHLGVGCEYFTAVGSDTYSDHIQSALREHDIDASNIVVDKPARPGLYLIETDSGGERSFCYWRDTSAARRWLTNIYRFKKALRPMARRRALYWSGITLALMSEDVRELMFHFLAAYRQAGGKVYFDSNYRPALWNERGETLKNIYTLAKMQADIYLPSLEDEYEVQGLDREADVVKQLQTQCAGEVVLTTDTQAVHLTKASVVRYPLPRLAAVIDTTGAGDAFSGGVIAAITRGACFEDAIVFAHQLAARVVNVRGAILPPSQWQECARELDQVLA